MLPKYPQDQGIDMHATKILYNMALATLLKEAAGLHPPSGLSGIPPRNPMSTKPEKTKTITVNPPVIPEANQK